MQKRKGGENSKINKRRPYAYKRVMISDSSLKLLIDIVNWLIKSYSKQDLQEAATRDLGRIYYESLHGHESVAPFESTFGSRYDKMFYVAHSIAVRESRLEILRFLENQRVKEQRSGILSPINHNSMYPQVVRTLSDYNFLILVKETVRDKLKYKDTTARAIELASSTPPRNAPLPTSPPAKLFGRKFPLPSNSKEPTHQDTDSSEDDESTDKEETEAPSMKETMDLKSKLENELQSNQKIKKLLLADQVKRQRSTDPIKKEFLAELISQRQAPNSMRDDKKDNSAQAKREDERNPRQLIKFNKVSTKDSSTSEKNHEDRLALIKKRHPIIAKKRLVTIARRSDLFGISNLDEVISGFIIPSWDQLHLNVPYEPAVVIFWVHKGLTRNDLPSKEVWNKVCKGAVIYFVFASFDALSHLPKYIFDDLLHVHTTSHQILNYKGSANYFRQDKPEHKLVVTCAVLKVNESRVEKNGQNSPVSYALQDVLLLSSQSIDYSDHTCCIDEPSIPKLFINVERHVGIIGQGLYPKIFEIFPIFPSVAHWAYAHGSMTAQILPPAIPSPQWINLVTKYARFKENEQVKQFIERAGAELLPDMMTS